MTNYTYTQIATLAHNLITDKRDDGTEFIKLREDAPKNIRNFMHSIHDGMLPCDEIYNAVSVIANTIVDCNDDDADDDDLSETIITDNLSTWELFNWAFRFQSFVNDCKNDYDLHNLDVANIFQSAYEFWLDELKHRTIAYFA